MLDRFGRTVCTLQLAIAAETSYAEVEDTQVKLQQHFSLSRIVYTTIQTRRISLPNRSFPPLLPLSTSAQPTNISQHSLQLEPRLLFYITEVSQIV